LYSGTDDQDASEVSYDNTSSGLTAGDVQAAIDEVVDYTSLLGEVTVSASRNAALGDANGMVNSTAASDITITIPTNATVAFPVGTVLSYRRQSGAAGNVIVSLASGVTDEDSNTGAIAQTYKEDQVITIWKTATDTWELVGSPSDDIDYWTVSLTAKDGTAATATDVEDFEVYEDMHIVNVYAYHATAGTTGVSTYDINEDGTSILSTKLTVDSVEQTSRTAATAAVISDDFIDAGSVISFDIDGVSTTAPEGVKITIAFIKGN
jgi:hypothetical protein